MGPSLLVLKMLTRLKSSSRNGKTLNRLSQPDLVLVILTIHTQHSQYEHNAVVEALVFTTPGDWLLQLNHGGRLHQPVESRCLGQALATRPQHLLSMTTIPTGVDNAGEAQELFRRYMNTE